MKNTQRFHQKIPRTISGKTENQPKNTIMFLYTNNEPTKEEMSKTIPFQYPHEKLNMVLKNQPAKKRLLL